MPIKAPTDGKPFDPKNRMWVGAAIGSLGTTILTGGAPLLPFIMTFVGGFTGYQIGKKQRNQEIANKTKLVPEPTYLNGGMAKGFVWGGVKAGLIVAAVAVASGVGLPALLAMKTTGALALGLLDVAITGYFMYKGSTERKYEMEADYQAAQQYQQNGGMPSQEQQQAQGKGKSQEQQKEKAKAYQFDNSEMVAKRNGREWGNDPSVKRDVASSKSIA
jgi:hypothetical protein